MLRYSVDTPQARQLRDEGFCIFPNALDAALIAELREATDALLAERTAENIRRSRYQGSDLRLAYQFAVFARLIAWPKTLEALSALGFADPKWRSSHILSKAPGAPALYWHQDWTGWDDPCSSWEVAPQLFVMHYLTDTCPENGCLRVIPGTHRRRIALHDRIPPAHSDATYSAGQSDPMFARDPDEVDVPAKAGDAVIGDVRVLHAAHANRSEERRTCLTHWYLPAYQSLPESMQAAMARRLPLEPPDWWDRETGRPVESLIPWYAGNAEPTAWNRVPKEHLAR